MSSSSSSSSRSSSRSSSSSSSKSVQPSSRSSSSTSVVPDPEQQISLGKIYLDINTLQPYEYIYFYDKDREIKIANLLDLTELPTDMLKIKLNELFSGQGYDEQCQKEKEYLLKAIEDNTKKISQVLSSPVVSHGS